MFASSDSIPFPGKKGIKDYLRSAFLLPAIPSEETKVPVGDSLAMFARSGFFALPRGGGLNILP
jgi:hypothetical protein